MVIIYYYVLLGIGGWSYNEYNIMFLIAISLCSIILMFIASVSEKIQFWKMMMFASIALNFSYIALSSTLFSGYFPVPVFMAIYGLLFSLNICAMNMVFVPVVGRISKYLPEGFESTGVTLVVPANKVGFNVFSILTEGWLLSTYRVQNGYFSRLRTPQMICDTIFTLNVLVGPLFLWTG